MSMLDDVSLDVRAALVKAARARTLLEQAGVLLGEAVQDLVTTVAGSSDPETEQAIGTLTQAQADLEHVHRTLIQAETRLENYLDSLRVTSNEPTRITTSSTAPPSIGPDTLNRPSPRAKRSSSSGPRYHRQSSSPADGRRTADGSIPMAMCTSK